MRVVGGGGRGEGVGELVDERAGAAGEAVEEVGVDFGLLEREDVGPDGGLDVGFGLFCGCGVGVLAVVFRDGNDNLGYGKEETWWGDH